MIGAAIGFVCLIVALFLGCEAPRPQKGGFAATSLTRPGFTNSVTLNQSENPKEPSRQSVESEQSFEYVLPPGTQIFPAGADSSLPILLQNGFAFSDETGSPMSQRHGGFVRVDRPVPIRMLSKDRVETSIGGSQKDTLRELAAKAAALRPVLWVGIILMTLVAGTLIYFGWWTKAGVALAIGAAMIVLSQALPDHATLIMLAGLGLYALTALLVLYAYHKGQLDQNHNGIPDALEKSLPY